MYAVKLEASDTTLGEWSAGAEGTFVSRSLQRSPSMRKRPFVVNRSGSSRDRESKRIEKQPEFERRIESGSNNVASLVTELAGPFFPVFPTDGDPTDEILETLLVKESKLRWLVRVAKYSRGANREALWREAERELARLEHDAEGLMQLACA
jgi:hypothetical protein